MEKETFSSELDRLIWPFIEIIADRAPAVGPDKDSDEPTRFQADVPASNLTVTMQITDATKCDVLVTFADESVYHRFNGRTYALRPGEWVWSIYKHGAELIDKANRDEIADALETARAKTENFMPI